MSGTGQCGVRHLEGFENCSGIGSVAKVSCFSNRQREVERHVLSDLLMLAGSLWLMFLQSRATRRGLYLLSLIDRAPWESGWPAGSVAQPMLVLDFPVPFEKGAAWYTFVCRSNRRFFTAAFGTHE